MLTVKRIFQLLRTGRDPAFEQTDRRLEGLEADLRNLNEAGQKEARDEPEVGS